MFILFFIAVLIVVICLILHSVKVRGREITFSFFFFSFVWAFYKESILPYSLISPYELMSKNISPTLVVLTVVLGWIFTFYISWYLAERILKRTVYFKKNLFATLLVGMWVTGCISYAVESTGIEIGWWSWKETSAKFSEYFVVSGSFTDAWMDFYLYFMLPFFLIEYSRFKEKYWRWIFVLIPISFLLFGRDSQIYRTLTIDSVILLAFLNPLALMDKNGQARFRKTIDSVLTHVPIFSVLVMLCVTVPIDLFALKNPSLLYSKLPIAACLFLAIPNIPIVAVVGGSAIAVFLWGKLVIPAFVVGFIILLILVLDRIRTVADSRKNTPGNKAWSQCLVGAYWTVLVVLVIFLHCLFSQTNILRFVVSRQGQSTISGEVVFEEYQGGIIKIQAYRKPFKMGDIMIPNDVVAYTRLKSPGPFVLNIPQDIKEIYLYAMGRPKQLPIWIRDPRVAHSFGSYEGNPFTVTEGENGKIVINMRPINEIKKTGL